MKYIDGSIELRDKLELKLGNIYEITVHGQVKI